MTQPCRHEGKVPYFFIGDINSL